MNDKPPLSQRAALEEIRTGVLRYNRGLIREVADRGLDGKRRGFDLPKEMMDAARVVFGQGTIEHGITSLAAGSRRWVRIDGEAVDRLKLAIETMMGEAIASEGTRDGGE